MKTCCRLTIECPTKSVGKRNSVYNEIILDGMHRLPKKYSDRVIKYVCNNIESNLFEETSGNGDKLLLAKLVLEKHSKYCSDNVFTVLEESLASYTPSRAKDMYQRRLEIRNDGYFADWSFWGDLQNELLDKLPNHRMSNKTKDLLSVLRRKYPRGADLYLYSGGRYGSVKL